MDASGSMSLDLIEISPFLHYSFSVLFGVELTTAQTESLFLIMDVDQSTEVRLSFLLGIIHYC
jgi:hypothetical protein